MVITYGAHKRPPYIGYQSAQIHSDSRFILVPNSRALYGYTMDTLYGYKKISKPVNQTSLDGSSDLGEITN